MPKFILELSLGNDGLRTPYGIQLTLKNVAKRIHDADFNLDDMKDPIAIRDINGNTVGHYEVRE